MNEILEGLPDQRLSELRTEWSKAFEAIQRQKLQLDLSRGKPSHKQLELSHHIANQVVQDFFSSDGTDARNYGNLKGVIEARELGALILDSTADETFAVGNSSLSLMHLVASTALNRGLWDNDKAWNKSTQVKMITPVPGYDRHFTVCESLGIEMINVKMTERGPCIEQVEELVRQDPDIKGIWCVPKYSNPTGCTYSNETVEALAEVPTKAAANNFVVFWDNAYAAHHLDFPGEQLASIKNAAIAAGTQDHVVQFGSTSKITFASGGIGFLSSSATVLNTIEQQISIFSIGSDKVNQLRHARFLNENLDQHMKEHARLLKPKFNLVQEHLEQYLSSLGIATWTQPKGGYFVSMDMQYSIADKVIEMAKTAGLVLTPAGATYPKGTDKENRNIRIAPSFADEEELKMAMQVLTLSVKLASVQHLINGKA